MNGLIINYGIVAVFSAAFLVLPPHVSARVIAVKPPSRLWIRWFGGFGLLWSLLGFAALGEWGLLELSPMAMRLLFAAKCCILGIMMGLFIAILTRRFEQAEVSRNPKGSDQHSTERNA